MGAESARKPYFKPFFRGVQVDVGNFSGVQGRVLYSRNNRKAASSSLTAKKRLMEFSVKPSNKFCDGHKLYGFVL